jgi:hypothetical protein
VGPITAALGPVSDGKIERNGYGGQAMRPQEPRPCYTYAMGVAILVSLVFGWSADGEEHCERIAPAVSIAVDLFRSPTDDNPIRIIEPSLIASTCVLANQSGRYQVKFQDNLFWVSRTQFRKATPEPPEPVHGQPPTSPAAPVAKGNSPYVPVGAKIAPATRSGTGSKPAGDVGGAHNAGPWSPPKDNQSGKPHFD